MHGEFIQVRNPGDEDFFLRTQENEPSKTWVPKPGVGVIIGWGRQEVIGSVRSLRYQRMDVQNI